MEFRIFCILVVLFIVSLDQGQSESTEPDHTVEYYTDRCLDGKFHKDKPGPESDLYNQCAPWKNRSCCTDEITEDLHIQPIWHDFNWNHCDTPLSPICEQWMRQDLCFYECSPNVGPWLVPHNISIRNERFMLVPLCESECNVWFEACRNDFTCKVNWAKGWDWSSGQNECPADETCDTFENKFGNAKNMCEKIWNQSYSVVPDSDPCMVLWFDPSRGGNPNEKVALAKAQELVGGASRLGPCISTSLAVAMTTALLMARWPYH